MITFFLVGPSNVTISLPVEINANEETTLKCTVVGSKPAVHPTWSGFQDIEHQVSNTEVSE